MNIVLPKNRKGTNFYSIFCSISTTVSPPEWRGQQSIVSSNEFFDNWNLFTQGMFKDINWNNVVVAGGSVLGCLLPGNIYIK